MSPERDNDLNEQELRELLKDYEATDLSRSSRKKAERKPAGNGKSKTVVTERRKKALVWYLAGLFGIAFAVVLLSLFLSGNIGQLPGTGETGTKTAQIQELYNRINELESVNREIQTENRDLETRNQELQVQNEELQRQIMEQQEMLHALNVMLDNMSVSMEYVEGSQNADAQLNIRKLNVYETLVKAQAAFIDYDEEALEAAVAELAENLDLLSEDAINAYYMVIEHMEQPYLGQE